MASGAPVTCAACGCRLTENGDAWFHFNPLAGRDARGCRVGCADAAHDVDGSPDRRRRLTGPRRRRRRVPRAAGAHSLDHDPVADAADRHHVRPAGRLDLGAQAREVRLQPEQIRVGLGRPAGTRQLEVRDDVAVRPDERLEQAELGRRERQRGLADARLVAARLQDERPGLERPAGRSATGTRPVDAAHDRGDPGQQLGLAERLRQVVVGAEPERPDLGGLAALARHDHDRRLADGAHLAGDAEPVRPGHREVQQDEVRVLLAEALDGGQAVVGGDDLVTLGPDQRGDRADHGRVVIDDKDPEWTGAHRDHVPLDPGSDRHGGGQGDDEAGAVGASGLAPQAGAHGFTESLGGIQADARSRGRCGCRVGRRARRSARATPRGCPDPRR